MLRRDHLSRTLGTATLLLFFGAASVHAQQTTPDTSGAAGATTGTKNATPPAGAADKSAAAGKLSKADAGMLRDMANVNISEVAAAKIALDKSKNEHVQAYAKQMVDDHSKGESELQQLAQKKGATLPTEPDKKHQAAAKKLSALSGDQFDRAYIKQNGIQDHTDARKMLMRVKDKATDADVKGAADKTLPTVEQHLKMAKELPLGKAGGGGGGAAPKPDTSGAPGGAGK
ncbi:MAG: putative rane protein [Burkholderiales bacterium]